MPPPAPTCNTPQRLPAFTTDPDPDWTTVRNNIPILHFEDGTTREHAGYNGEKIKQADVNLLAYPLKEVTTAANVRKDLDYYEPRVGEGPAMTHAIFSILYERLGLPDKAYQDFKEGYTPNLRPPLWRYGRNRHREQPLFRHRRPAACCRRC